MIDGFNPIMSPVTQTFEFIPVISYYGPYLLCTHLFSFLPLVGTLNFSSFQFPPSVLESVDPISIFLVETWLF